MKNEVKGFHTEYAWLSNFYLCDVMYTWRKFPSVEHAYQYAKVFLPSGEDYKNVVKMTPAQAKRWGRNVDLRDDWDQIKLGVMADCLYSKFTLNLKLREALKELQDYYLEETNHWNDTYWGVCDGKGENHLGKLLMATRNLILWQDKFA